MLKYILQILKTNTNNRRKKEWFLLNRKDLKDFKSNQESIKTRFDLIREMKAQITSITHKYTDMPNGSRQVYDSMAEKIAELVEMEEEYLQQVVEYNKKQKDILRQLDKVKQPYRLILDMIYLQGKDLVTVASERKYNYKYICNLHGQALIEFENVEKYRQI